jgi:hypothetical protein
MIKVFSDNSGGILADLVAGKIIKRVRRVIGLALGTGPQAVVDDKGQEREKQPSRVRFLLEKNVHAVSDTHSCRTNGPMRWNQKAQYTEAVSPLAIYGWTSSAFEFRLLLRL